MSVSFGEVNPETCGSPHWGRRDRNWETVNASSLTAVRIYLTLNCDRLDAFRTVLKAGRFW